MRLVRSFVSSNGVHYLGERLCRAADGNYLTELLWARQFRIAIMQSNGGFLRRARLPACRTDRTFGAGGRSSRSAETARPVVSGGFWGSTWAAPPPMSAWPTGRRARPPKRWWTAFRFAFRCSIFIRSARAVGPSRAWTRAGVRVGPESAGADPGPACYGMGTEATVTDAHVVLGRMRERCWAGHADRCGARRGRCGSVAQDEARSHRRRRRAFCVSPTPTWSGRFGWSRSSVGTILAILRWSRSGVRRAACLRNRAGAGHPNGDRAEYAGALSALGMLMADAVRDYAAGVLGRGDIEKQFDVLERRARRESPGAEIERRPICGIAGRVTS